MPVVSLPLDDTDKSVLSEVYFKIVEDIVDSIKIPVSSLVIIHKDIETTLTDNKTNAVFGDKNNIPSTVSNRRIIANITENYNEETLATTSINQLSSFPIYLDNDINTSVYPIYIMSEINIEFSYISPSKSEAIRIRDDIRMKLSQYRNINIHDVEYNILLPTIVEDFISDVYDLKNRLIPQGLEDYVREHSTKRLHIITDTANKQNTRIAIRERQIRIVGLFDFSPIPEKIEIDNENNNYKITFNYKFNMDVPRAIAMRYPVMICNKPLPSKYLQFIEDNKRNSKEELNRNLNYIGFGSYNLSHFEAHRQLENRIDIKLPRNIPLFDDFSIRQGHKGYCITTSLLTDVNETDFKTLFNLRNIDPYYINEDILNLLVNGERSYVVSPYSSFIYFGLYQDDIHFDNSILDIDSNLNVSSKVNLSLFKPVRVTISFILDITMLNMSAIDRLLLNDNIVKIFINEYINIYKNYKLESNKSLFAINDMYKTFIYMLYHYLTIENNDMLRYIVDNIKIDENLSSNLFGNIKTSYNNLYRYLDNNDMLSNINPSSGNIIENGSYTFILSNKP